MAGETDLKNLLKDLSPHLHTGDYVFCSIPGDLQLPSAKIIGSFREEEGTTQIIDRDTADDLGISYEGIMAWITLKVHSSLLAVGLTATVSSALAKNGISCNVIAAYYHDHLFVPKADAAKAMDILTSLRMLT